MINNTPTNLNALLIQQALMNSVSPELRPQIYSICKWQPLAVTIPRATISDILHAYVFPRSWSYAIHPEWFINMIHHPKHTKYRSLLCCMVSEKVMLLHKSKFPHSRIAPTLLPIIMQVYMLDNVIAPKMDTKRVFLSDQFVAHEFLDIISTKSTQLTQAINMLGIIDIAQATNKTISGLSLVAIIDRLSESERIFLNDISTRQIIPPCFTSLSLEALNNALQSNDLPKLIYGYSIARLFHIISSADTYTTTILLQRIPPSMNIDLTYYASKHQNSIIIEKYPFLSQLKTIINFLKEHHAET